MPAPHLRRQRQATAHPACLRPPEPGCHGLPPPKPNPYSADCKVLKMTFRTLGFLRGMPCLAMAMKTIPTNASYGTGKNVKPKELRPLFFWHPPLLSRHAWLRKGMHIGIPRPHLPPATIHNPKTVTSTWATPRSIPWVKYPRRPPSGVSRAPHDLGTRCIQTILIASVDDTPLRFMPEYQSFRLQRSALACFCGAPTDMNVLLLTWTIPAHAIRPWKV